uniref:Uncharacterized protein n=1 Tax=Anguilla anguilla TaxID=7936 RepID=A0A0E9W2Y0_ANGAN
MKRKSRILISPWYLTWS